MPIPPAELVRQFLLSRSADLIPDAWEPRELNGWHLGVHPTLPVVPVSDQRGAPAGWLLGWPVTSDGDLVTEGFRLPVGSDCHVWEDELYRLAGAWVLIFLAGQVQRVYPDAMGTMSVIYCGEREIVASSTALVPTSPPTEVDRPLADAFGLPARDHWYPFGLTPRKCCRRLLPNHALDLASWTASRHWPRRDSSERYPAETIAPEVASHLRTQIEGLVRTEVPVHMNLTAGHDTRMLLACARGVRDRIEFHTSELPDRSGRKDARIAKILAHRHGLRHTMRPSLEASEEERDRWQERVGHCVAGRVWRYSGIPPEHEEQDAILLPGLGSFGKGLYWRRRDTERTPLSPPDLVSRLHLPNVPAVEAAAARWLEELPVTDTLIALGLLLWEQRMGCWASPQCLGLTSRSVRILPFNHRPLADRLIHIVSDDQRAKRLPVYVIRLEWPELLQLPFNRYPSWRGVVELGEKAWEKGVQRLRTMVHT